jgi:hypothetical protein
MLYEPVTWWTYDCEFLETARGTLELVSIAFVDRTGQREYYAVSTAFDPDDAVPWVRQHVLPQLPEPSHGAWRSRERIRADLEELLLADEDDPELWAWYAAYDHVVFAQLWGMMPALPRRLPRFTHDLRSLWDLLGRPPLPRQPSGLHDALADARHNLARWHALEPARRAYGLGD